MARDKFVPDPPTQMFVPTGTGNVAKAIAAQNAEKRTVLGLPQPVIPKAVQWRQNGNGLLVFDGQSFEVELTDVIYTKGGAPELVVTEYEGQRPRTALDPAPLGTCTVAMIVQSNAQYVHDVILARCRAGQVLRVYGPVVGPYPQGTVWGFAGMPEPKPILPMNANGTINKFTLTLELSEWQPMGSLKPQAGSRVGTDGPRKRAAQKPDRDQLVSTGAVNVGRFFNG